MARHHFWRIVRWSLSIALLMLIAVYLVILNGPWGSVPVQPLFGGTSAIVFIQRVDEGSDRQLTVSDPAEVGRMISTINLKRKAPCLCAHHNTAIFQKTNARIRVSFCK